VAGIDHDDAIVRYVPGERATSSTVALNLVTGSNAGTSSISW